MNCKNCGHEIYFVGENCYHMRYTGEGDRDIELTHRCQYEFEERSKDDEEYVVNLLKEYERKLIERFGENIDTGFFFVSVECNCSNPSL